MKRWLVSEGPFQVNEAILCALNVPYVMDIYGNCIADIADDDKRLLEYADRIGVENISGSRNKFRIEVVNEQ